jgi:peptide/nickel transport system substrate-binding protein
MKRFTRRIFALSVLATVVALVVAACGGGDPTATSRPAPTVAAATATPVPAASAVPEAVVGAVPDFPDAKYGGTLIRAKSSEGPGWDGHVERTENTHDIVDLAYDQIVMVDPHDELSGMVPQLADSWEVGSDGLTYTFNIHPGVKFHNGNDLTASDFRFTYEDVVLNPPEGVRSIQKGLFASAESVSTPDDLTVVVHLSEPNAAFLTIIGFGRMHIFDEQFIAAEGRDRMQQWPPMGTGPFMGEAGSWEKGVSVEVFKNPNYFVEGRPFLDGQKFFFIPDKGTRVAAFLTGQLNFGVRPTVDEAKEMVSKMGADVFIQKKSTTTFTSMDLDTSNPPFNDVRVREAAAWAIDKQGMADAVLQGLAVFGGTIIPGSGWDLPAEELATFAGYSGTREENIAKSKALLAEAGFANGFEADVWSRQHPAYVDHSVAARAMLEDVGITGEIVFAEQAVFFANQRNHDTWDIQTGGHRYNGTDPNFQLPEYWLEGGPRNLAGWSSPEIGDLYNQQNRELDPAKRKLLVNEIERLALGSYASIIYYYSVGQYAWTSNIKNYFTHSAYKANQQFRDVWME